MATLSTLILLIGALSTERNRQQNGEIAKEAGRQIIATMAPIVGQKNEDRSAQ